MPLKRTPPTSPLPSAFATTLQHLQSYASDSNLSEVGEDAGASVALSLGKFTNRPKRKRDNEVSKAELMEMFNALQKRQDEKFDNILCCINEVKTSVNLLASNYDVVLTKIELLEEERKTHKTHIQQLQNEVEMLQRYVRGTSIELRNIPQNQKETKDDLKKYICKIADILNITLQESDVKNIYRINSKAATKPIVADFSTVSTRDQFLNSYRKYNKAHHHEKLNTTLLHFGGVRQPVYLSENMTPQARKLYYQARVFAKSHHYAYCWSSSGRIFLRKEEGSPHILVSRESDLDDLKEQ